MSEYTIPFKVAWTPFKICNECGKRKLSVCLYYVYDNGLNSYIHYWVCRKCMKEAKERTRKKSKCTICGDVVDGEHKTLCNYCWGKRNEFFSRSFC